MSANESRPKAAPGTRGGVDQIVPGWDDIHEDLELTHRAWLAGYDLGLAHGRQLAVTHLAQELLHRQAAEMAGVAVAEADRRHGSGWADEIRAQASGLTE